MGVGEEINILHKPPPTPPKEGSACRFQGDMARLSKKLPLASPEEEGVWLSAWGRFILLLLFLDYIKRYA
jgi:hypothetical protein